MTAASETSSSSRRSLTATGTGPHLRPCPHTSATGCKGWPAVGRSRSLDPIRAKRRFKTARRGWRNKNVRNRQQPVRGPCVRPPLSGNAVSHFSRASGVHLFTRVQEGLLKMHHLHCRLWKEALFVFHSVHVSVGARLHQGVTRGGFKQQCSR